MQRIIAVANHKGGCGKTTTTFNLAGALAERGCSVLLVDMDAQAALSKGFDVVPPAGPSLADVLAREDVDLRRVICPTTYDLIQVIPADDRLREVELGLATKFAREMRLRIALDQYPVSHDIVLIDCAPSLGFLLGNALVAAHEVILPVDLGIDSLDAMNETMTHMQFIRRHLSPLLHPLGILVNNVRKSRTNYAEQAEDFLRSRHGELVFATHVHQSVVIPEAKSARQPIVVYQPRSTAADEYRQLAGEVISRGEKSEWQDTAASTLPASRRPSPSVTAR
jgi:chromosome partitioning protein